METPEPLDMQTLWDEGGLGGKSYYPFDIGMDNNMLGKEFDIDLKLDRSLAE